MFKSSKNRNRVSKVLACALALCMVVGAFAYFTDRVESNAKVTAGTVGIVEDATANWTNQLKDADGQLVLDNINPGDSRSLKFTLENTGNKAIDVRHTIKLSVVDANGKAKAISTGADVAGTQMVQFDIFKASDVLKTSEENNNAGYQLKQGAVPVFSTSTKDAKTLMGVERVVDAANGTVTYYFADSVLDGTGNQAETGYAKAEQIDTEFAATDAALVGTTAVTYDYVLIFRDTTLNDFQGCTLHVEMVAEAKQHLNTKSSWENVETITFQMVVSGDATQNTTINTAPNNHIGVLETVTDETAGTYNNNVAH